ncbi:hypothetical protein [Rhizobium leguminosarum]|uniref:hypothetical protein n=1 Tax=Rhizobium leguminosarum TaxID=384 RepID=UPI001C922948|nr:hypothetical protein [Rhizobium leguminosarum]MBY2998412.1 hypothetical protein [Rhizobium leguminosarum]
MMVTKPMQKRFIHLHSVFVRITGVAGMLPAIAITAAALFVAEGVFPCFGAPDTESSGTLPSQYEKMSKQLNQFRKSVDRYYQIYNDLSGYLSENPKLELGSTIAAGNAVLFDQATIDAITKSTSDLKELNDRLQGPMLANPLTPDLISELKFPDQTVRIAAWHKLFSKITDFNAQIARWEQKTDSAHRISADADRSYELLRSVDKKLEIINSPPLGPILNAATDGKFAWLWADVNVPVFDVITERASVAHDLARSYDRTLADMRNDKTAYSVFLGWVNYHAVLDGLNAGQPLGADSSDEQARAILVKSLVDMAKTAEEVASQSRRARQISKANLDQANEAKYGKIVPWSPNTKNESPPVETKTKAEDKPTARTEIVGKKEEKSSEDSADDQKPNDNEAGGPGDPTSKGSSSDDAQPNLFVIKKDNTGKITVEGYHDANAPQSRDKDRKGKGESEGDSGSSDKSPGKRDEMKGKKGDDTNSKKGEEKASKGNSTQEEYERRNAMVLFRLLGQKLEESFGSIEPATDPIDPSYVSEVGGVFDATIGNGFVGFNPAVDPLPPDYSPFEADTPLILSDLKPNVDPKQPSSTEEPVIVTTPSDGPMPDPSANNLNGLPNSSSEGKELQPGLKGKANSEGLVRSNPHYNEPNILEWDQAKSFSSKQAQVGQISCSVETSKYLSLREMALFVFQSDSAQPPLEGDIRRVYERLLPRSTVRTQLVDSNDDGGGVFSILMDINKATSNSAVLWLAGINDPFPQFRFVDAIAKSAFSEDRVFVVGAAGSRSKLLQFVPSPTWIGKDMYQRYLWDRNLKIVVVRVKRNRDVIELHDSFHPVLTQILREFELDKRILPQTLEIDVETGVEFDLNSWLSAESAMPLYAGDVILIDAVQTDDQTVKETVDDLADLFAREKKVVRISDYGFDRPILGRGISVLWEPFFAPASIGVAFGAALASVVSDDRTKVVRSETGDTKSNARDLGPNYCEVGFEPAN